MEPLEETTAEPASHYADSMPVTLAIGVFVLGLFCGIPATIFGLDFFVENAITLFAVLFGLLLLTSLLTGVIVAFRRPILRKVVKRGEVEMERIAGPLAEVAKHAAAQDVDKATNAAREVGELMLARYAWVATRRWLIATITAFVAAIAALAGSALLFQQNQLLKDQGTLLGDQTQRLAEQNRLLSQQIELGEAQRSTSIVPEILSIGALVGEETKKLMADGRPNPIFFDHELSHSLRGRIIAATAAARPYRYLASNFTNASEEKMAAIAIERLTDVPGAQKQREAVLNAEALVGHNTGAGELIDRPVSPERGQILSLLYNARVMNTEWLTLNGADFSFAEIRNHTFGVISLKHALLRFADFSGVSIHQGVFRAAFLENARFNRATIVKSDFSAIAGDDIQPPHTPDPTIATWPTNLSGADFRGTKIFNTSFAGSNGLAINFDYALLMDVDFTNASLAASTFRNAIIGEIKFKGANLASIDLDGAYVFKSDFLQSLQNQAAANTFKLERYELKKLTIDQLKDHPNALHLDTILQSTTAQSIWQIKRIADFE